MRPFRASILRRPPGILRRRQEPPTPEQPTPPQDDGASSASATQGQGEAGTSTSTPPAGQAGTSEMPPPEVPPQPPRRGHPGVQDDKRRNRIKCAVKGCDSTGMIKIQLSQSRHGIYVLNFCRCCSASQTPQQGQQG